MHARDQRRGQDRDGGYGSDNQLWRGAESRIDQEGDGDGVQADLNRHPGDGRVPEGLRDSEGGDDHAGHDVGTQTCAPVQGQPGHDGEAATQSSTNPLPD